LGFLAADDKHSHDYEQYQFLHAVLL